MKLCEPMMGSQNKILGSVGTSYPTYLDPWLPLFGIFSLWRSAMSVKMNGYIRWYKGFFVWIFSIDWCLNWPYLNFISWDMVHWEVLMKWWSCIVKKNRIFFQKIDTEKIFPTKRIKVRALLVELWTFESRKWPITAYIDFFNWPKANNLI